MILSLYRLSLLVLLLGLFGGPRNVAAQSTCDAVFYPEGCFSDRITLRRYSFVDNLRKEVSCYVRGHSSESIMIHVLLVFADPVNHFHNALILNPASVEKYKKIMRESEFPFNNEMMIVTRGREMVVQYDVANSSWQMHYFDGNSLPEVPIYDAILSLDYFASLWSEYNSIVLERSFISLRMIEPPFDVDKASDNQDYDGFYKLWCNQSQSVNRCHVILSPNMTSGGMVINDRTYDITGLIIDTGSSVNLLPYDLFVRWKYHGERNLRISASSITVGDASATVGDAAGIFLHLNDQFEYDINHESGDIVLGVDFLLLFQKAEYCMEAGYYKVWYYNHLYSWHEQHLLNVTLICLFVTTLLSIFFYWVTSVNYDVLDNVLRGERRMSFPYLIVLCELLTYVIGVAIVIMALIFADDVGSVMLDATGHKQRAILFTVVLLCHLVTGLVYLAWFRRSLTRKAAAYYGQSGWNAARGTDLRITYTVTATPVGESKVRDVIVRNTTLNTTLAMALLLIFNYLAEDWPLFLAINVIISSIVAYYWFKMLLVSFFYLITSHRIHHSLWRYERRFVILTCLSLLLFIAYAVLAFPLVYLDCFSEFNSMYSDIFLWIFATHIYCLIGIFAAGIVFIIIVRHYIERNRPPAERKKKTD